MTDTNQEGMVEVRSEGELISKLYGVSLRGSKTIKPYKGAVITIERLNPAILAPTQRYVLKKEIRKIEDLRWAIDQEYGQDILRLNGYLKVKYPDQIDSHGQRYDIQETIDILPPIVEEYIDFVGNIHYIICDGQHRAYLAYMMGLPVHVALVRAINTNYPYYAYPLPNGWADVELRDDIPSGYVKKFHVAKDHKFLYRDFNSQFENIGDSRPYEKQSIGISEKDMPPPLPYRTITKQPRWKFWK